MGTTTPNKVRGRETMIRMIITIINVRKMQKEAIVFFAFENQIQILIDTQLGLGLDCLRW